ncbi:MAG: cyclic nucleotide-binding domain-containing protein [Leptolyngbyaceae cyanobacterium CSU_1_4]|nr:cyclic nucleotide-binding domain-containing protein [Leptolyngbyaceae cyanobacterium CSU_1_4]
MTTILLRELASGDIDWMVSAGQQIKIVAGEVFLQAREKIKHFYLVLEGELTAIQLDSDQTEQAVYHFGAGDVIDAFFLLDKRSMLYSVKAQTEALLFAIPLKLLEEKLRQDILFGGRFYRAIAMMLSQKQWQMTAQASQEILQLKSAMLQSHQTTTKGILLVFSCLNDSDMCWMISKGSLRQVASGKTHLREGQPLDAIEIVLQGQLSLMVDMEQHHLLSVVFGATKTSPQQTIAQIMPGELLGVTAFLDMTPNIYTLQAQQDTLLLSLPLTVLAPKLQQDAGFAARFYQALANLSAEQLFQILCRVGCSGAKNYQPGNSLCEASSYEEEMDVRTLQQISVARARFNWMLQQLGIGV